jgi:lysozyme
MRAALFNILRDNGVRITPPLVAGIDGWCDAVGVPKDAAAAPPPPSQSIPGVVGSQAPQVRKTGLNGRKLIQSFEQCRPSSYMPTPNDVPTIGWGSTGADIKMGMTWTQAQCDERFATDLGRFERAVSAAIGNAPTTQNQFDAMVSLAFNIGSAGFSGSTVARKHKAGDHAWAANAFLMWNKQKGAVLRGLTRRREAERLLYLDPSA